MEGKAMQMGGVFLREQLILQSELVLGPEVEQEIGFEANVSEVAVDWQEEKQHQLDLVKKQAGEGKDLGHKVVHTHLDSLVEQRVLNYGVLHNDLVEHKVLNCVGLNMDLD